MDGNLQRNPEPVIDRYSTAASQYGLGRFDEALSQLAPLLHAPTTGVHVLNLAAACCLLIDRPRDAETYWRRALAVKPDYTDALNNLGVALKEQGRLAEAEACYRQALAISPCHAGAHVNMGRLFAELGRPAEAEAAYLHAIRLQPADSDTFLNLGVLYQDQVRLSEAEAAYRHAIAARPDAVKAHFNLGVVLKMQKRFDEAEMSYRQTLALRPDYFEVKLNLAHLLLTSDVSKKVGRCLRLATIPSGRSARSRRRRSIVRCGAASRSWADRCWSGPSRDMATACSSAAICRCSGRKVSRS
ncbi:tetratricopeptide repeat protein [Paraburkholderia bengalensis]|uniref:tetratricopeptide repeat protein n=1 Tax=Paraburkholderia bengalensis TaxID=2747562 RepID=UPI00301528AA